MKLEFSQQIFKECSEIIFKVNMFSGSRVVPYGQTEKWTDMTKTLVSHFMQFWECVKKIHNSN
jgi:hypothetical protein